MLFRIKGWAITIFSTFILFALGENGASLHIVFGAITVLLFWFLDSSYRRIQLGHVDRYNIIEDFLRSDDFTQWIDGGDANSTILPDIVNHKNSSAERRSLIKTLFDSGTAPTYIILLFLSLGILSWMLVSGS